MLPELGPFQLLGELGRGGMAIVYHARDIRLDRSVALKVMLPEVAQQPGAKERFLREARSAARLTHDHIVPIWQVGEENGIPFIAMPLLPGESLADHLRRNTPLPLSLALRIAREVALGLAAAHAHQVIHRDIKPSNVWLERDPEAANPCEHFRRVRLLDFGIARLADDEAPNLTESGMIVGTPAYMSPEQIRGEAVDGRTDLWSLGVVLYVMLTGQTPFAGKTNMATMISAAVDPVVPVSDRVAQVPKEVSNLVLQLMAKNPSDRPNSAAAVAETLASMERTVVAEPTLPPWLEPPAALRQARAIGSPNGHAAPPAPPRLRPWLIALGCFSVLLLGGGITLEIIDRLGRKATYTVPANAHVSVDANGKVIVDLSAPDSASPNAAPPVTPATTAPANPVPPSSSGPAEVSSQQLQRDLAKLAFHRRGIVQVKLPSGDSQYIYNIEGLPSGPFEVTVFSVINHGTVTDEDLMAMGAVKSLRRVEVWASQGVTNRGLEALAQLEDLNRLNLGGTQVNDEGVQYLAGMKNLTHLYLSHTKVTGKSLLALSRLPALQVLHLNGLGLEDQSAAHLDQFPALRQISLEVNPVGDGCLRQLQAVKTLERVCARNTKVTAAGVADLHAAIPNLVVSWDGHQLDFND